MRKLRTLLALCAMLAVVGCSTPATESSPSSTVETQTAATGLVDPASTFQQRCVQCHDGSVPKAPHQVSFQIIGRDSIYQALTDGMMQVHVQGLTDPEIQSLASHLGGSTVASEPVKMCAQTKSVGGRPAHQGWSLTQAGTRFVPPEKSGIDRSNVAGLQLKWAFAFPGASRARSQPVILGDYVLVGSQDGTVYALELDSGCSQWTFKADAEVRSAIALSDDGRQAYFGDIVGNVYALNSTDGSLRWKQLAHSHPDVTLTGSPRLYQDHLYVPLSSSEWARAADPGYGCCTFRGGVVAMNTDDGSIDWTAYAIPEAAQLTGKKNELGAAMRHPAGAPIWNSPTIDEKRGTLYVGTGEAYTSPAADTSDSVIAFDLATGDMRWFYQSISGDAWNMACFIGGTANCPEENGPDLDIGAPPVITTLANGEDRIIAGQKSGHVFALDPEDGSLLWRNKIGRGGFAGGVHWGLAVSPERIYAPNADTIFTGRFKGEPKPGLFALDPANGEIEWFTPAPNICAEADKPACDPGLSAAVTATEEVVFAGAFDGHLRAYDAANGKILWDFNTNTEFATVSGELAHGGSIESDGPVLYNGHVLVNSGYLFGDRMPGNVLLVFANP
ncbi:MAG: PQQ-binding-like beta-propeller repeat protein [Pseudomonadales bacterium]